VWFVWTWWLNHRPAGDDPLPSLADARAVAPLTLPDVAARARRLRPSLAATPTSLIQPGQAGVALGAHKTGRTFGRRGSGTILYASLKDVIIAVMAPRAGKTTALTAPGILDAPGAVVATSNKPDVWTTTAAAREARGTVWVFDPQAITHSQRTWWWNPLPAQQRRSGQRRTTRRRSHRPGPASRRPRRRDARRSARPPR
jgi:hypothetical protein